MTDWLSEVLDGFENHPKTCRDIHCAKTGHFPAFDKAHKLISAQLIRERLDELYELSKSFESRKSYRGYMVKQVISARGKWVSNDGKIHIGIADVDKVAADLTNKLKEVEDE